MSAVLFSRFPRYFVRSHELLFTTPRSEVGCLDISEEDNYPITRAGNEVDIFIPACATASTEVYDEEEKEEEVESLLRRDPISPHKKSKHQKIKTFRLPPSKAQRSILRVRSR